nr:class I SAM-dependent methyltransferase [Nostoc sp. EkiNYC01]
MSSYTPMSHYYDTIMTSGYYNYEIIANSILNYMSARKILEIGCGTGLILEKLAHMQVFDTIVGVDLTEEMLAIAEKRLHLFSHVKLSLQNIIDLSLPEEYDLAFSYGGVWYFVIDGDREPFLVSHLVSDVDNHQGFARLTKHIRPQGKLLLGIQGPHFDYNKVVSNGMVYSQKISPSQRGFIKDYYLLNGSEIMMQQTLHYSTYSFAEAQGLLETYGFKYKPAETTNKLFLEFEKL